MNDNTLKNVTIEDIAELRRRYHLRLAEAEFKCARYESLMSRKHTKKWTPKKWNRASSRFASNEYIVERVNLEIKRLNEELARREQESK